MQGFTSILISHPRSIVVLNNLHFPSEIIVTVFTNRTVWFAASDTNIMEHSPMIETVFRTGFQGSVVALQCIFFCEIGNWAIVQLTD